MTLSSPSDSLLAIVIVFLFSMLNKEDEHKDNNSVEYYNADLIYFYQGPIVVAKLY